MRNRRPSRSLRSPRAPRSRTLADETIVRGCTSWASPSPSPDESHGSAHVRGHGVRERALHHRPVTDRPQGVGRDRVAGDVRSVLDDRAVREREPEPLGRRVVVETIRSSAP